MISMNRCFYITSFTFKEFWLYELEPYIVCIEQNSVKYIQKVIYFNWMHVVYLSQQSRLTLLNMLTRFIRKFLQVFIFFFYPKICILEIQQMKNLWFFLFFYPKMCILEIQQMKIFVFSQTRNDFFQTVPYWLPEYDGVSKKWPFLSHLQQSMCDLF